MSASTSYTEVENVDGNCVIITTLTSTTDAMRRQEQIPPLSPTLSQPVMNVDHQWLPPFPPSSDLNSSMRSDAVDTAAVKTTDDYSCRYHPVYKYGIAKTEQDQNNIKNSTKVQALVPIDTNISLESCSLKRARNLGPLIVVRRSREVSTIERATSLTGVEKLSYRKEVDGLRAKLKQMEGMVAEIHQRTEEEIAKRLRSVEEKWREEERSRRQRFQEALSNLRVENMELSTRVQNMEESTRLVATQEREKIQKEWSTRLSDNDNQWRERFRVAQERWEECVENHMQGEQDALQKVQELAHAVEELEATLRAITREKEWVEKERDALLLSQSKVHNSDFREQEGKERMNSEVKNVLEAEVLTLRSALREAESREKALMTQLEVCGTESAAQELTLERQLQQTRHELEAERRRGSDIVALYSSQVESLHQQLNDSMRRNKQLTNELARIQQ
ncbi:uncharacterized protein TM35_000033940 [Trypanosoma theileri]|uniref:Uncharacterized protein n=1 Tax=Trypanosoma theileri TaxID=67003 RepID=A0A1X0P738_9TRYP|nr:uncharacterized protein TM35_000033940 [Trypanosoma theileri]ORC92641.1 hypothetical protein TM35_000033940 [Trypanosoma theileri]